MPNNAGISTDWFGKYQNFYKLFIIMFVIYIHGIKEMINVFAGCIGTYNTCLRVCNNFD